jgi:hypothetical protein
VFPLLPYRLVVLGLCLVGAWSVLVRYLVGTCPVACSVRRFFYIKDLFCTDHRFDSKAFNQYVLALFLYKQHLLFKILIFLYNLFPPYIFRDPDNSLISSFRLARNPFSVCSVRLRFSLCTLSTTSRKRKCLPCVEV